MIDWLVAGACVTNLLTPLALSRSVRGRLISSRQGFLTPGSDASLHGLPNLVAKKYFREISDLLFWKLCNRRYTVAGTVWAFHPTSLVALMGTCNGPTRLNVDAIDVELN